jgi:DHA3 family macrolide efflux protein-like MFS transporter
LGSTAFVYLLPVIGDRLLHVGAVALGWLWSALSLGILATTVWLIWKPQQTICTRIWMIAIAATIAAGALPSLLMHDSIVWAAGLIVAIGATSGLITPLVAASLQERTPKDLMARVFGLFNTGTMVSAMIGMTLFRWVADHFGPGISLAAIGVVNGVTATVAMVLLPSCYRLAKQSSAQPAQSLRKAS